ncbi:MAG: hypothetical protein JWM34_1269 [Ilumatobacteraceae bacterium]|nr:hypothetical protein [Ilumatobacteraceae bacterium]
MSDAVREPVALASDHFIQGLDFGFGEDRDGETMTLTVGVAPGMCDMGIAATLVDVAGGQVIMHARFPSIIATTHLELHGIDRLTGGGELRAVSRIIAMSKRRSIAEVMLHLDGAEAIAHVGFAVRHQENMPAMARDWGRPRRGLVLTEPLRDRLGMVTRPDGASVVLHPGVVNLVGGLQGGATVALMEAAALAGASAGARLADASVNYLGQVRGESVDAVVVHRFGPVITVDAIARPGDTPNTRAVFRTA